MTLPARTTERHADLFVACDSCGADTPASTLSGMSVPRARCASCTLAVEKALDDVVRQLVGLGDYPDRSATELGATPICFDCGASGAKTADGTSTSFTCAACGSHCFIREASTVADDALSA